MNLIKKTLIFAIFLLVFPIYSYTAIVPLLNPTPTTGSGFSFRKGFGAVFNVTKKLQIDSLGRHTLTGDGVVRLWKNGVQVTNATVTSSGLLSNLYRYVSITPIVFNIGDQLIIYHDAPNNQTRTTSIANLGLQDGLTFVNSYFTYNSNSLTPREDYNSTLSTAFKTVPIGANASYTLVPTPEPITYITLGSFLVLGFLLSYVTRYRSILKNK